MWTHQAHVQARGGSKLGTAAVFIVVLCVAVTAGQNAVSPSTVTVLTSATMPPAAAAEDHSSTETLTATSQHHAMTATAAAAQTTDTSTPPPQQSYVVTSSTAHHVNATTEHLVAATADAHGAVTDHYGNATDHHGNATDPHGGNTTDPHAGGAEDHAAGEHEGGHGGVTLASWHYEHVHQPLLLTLFILFAGLLKVGFHKMHFISSIVPESCLLIAVGVGFGAILMAWGEHEEFNMDPTYFMFYLLPPIVLDASYSLVDRVFIENLVYVLLFAVLGTVLTFLFIGPTMYGLALTGVFGTEITFLENLMFASFIVAVDPVAVLSVFQEVGVNDTLYFMVFGESLLNDGVTIVLTVMMTAFLGSSDGVDAGQIVLGIFSFFTIACGGLCIGLIFGVLSAIITKYTHDVRSAEPLFVLVIAYLSYLTAELFHWSGFISLIGCGMMQGQYTFRNIGRKSKTTIVYFMKVFSNTSENLIFMFLGLEMLRDSWTWNTAHALLATLFCLIYRLAITFFFCWCINKTEPSRPISYQDQFIMWYGGMRGAVCYALCDGLDKGFRHRDLFLTTTIFTILFTVFAQGMTIKPMVKLCKVQTKSDDDETMLEAMNVRVIDHTMAGIEEIVHQKGNAYIRNLFVTLNDKFLARWLQRDAINQDQKILELYADLILERDEQNLGELARRASMGNFLSHPLYEEDEDEENEEDKVGDLPTFEEDEQLTVQSKGSTGSRTTMAEIEKMLTEGKVDEDEILEVIQQKHLNKIQNRKVSRSNNPFFVPESPDDRRRKVSRISNDRGRKISRIGGNPYLTPDSPEDRRRKISRISFAGGIAMDDMDMIHRIAGMETSQATNERMRKISRISTTIPPDAHPNEIVERIRKISRISDPYGPARSRKTSQASITYDATTPDVLRRISRQEKVRRVSKTTVPINIINKDMAMLDRLQQLGSDTGRVRRISQYKAPSDLRQRKVSAPAYVIPTIVVDDSLVQNGKHRHDDKYQSRDASIDSTMTTANSKPNSTDDRAGGRGYQNQSFQHDEDTEDGVENRDSESNV